MQIRKTREEIKEVYRWILEGIPMFSINLGIRKTTISINPIIRPIGLFTMDMIENGSLICRKTR